MTTATLNLDNPTLKGAMYRSTHKMAVIGVLGDRAPKVSSRGTRFYNVDRWTLRVFVREMCMWAKGNAECVPTSKEIGGWVQTANKETVPNREIVIANTPAKLTLRTALALTGGAYHEAFHTYYSCLRSLDVDEMAKMVIPRWAKVPDWSKYYRLLQDWNNIIEDIRIERLGRIEFPGSERKLHDLQDFILAQESKGRSDVRAHGGGKAAQRGVLSIVVAAFRDVGLGYNTEDQRAALGQYQADNPDAVKFVLGAGKGNPGPLTELLKESILLSQADDIGCVRIAMDVIGVLYNESSEQDPANDENNDEHQPGETQKTVCPKCKAKGSKLVVRPKSDGQGGKVKGKGVLTCTVCGYQTDVDMEKKQKGQGQTPPQDPDYTPKFKGFDKDEDEDAQGGGASQQDGEDAGDEDSDAQQGGGSGKSDEDADDEDGDAQQGGGSGKSDEDADDEDGDAQQGGGSGKSDEDADENASDASGSSDDKDEGDDAEGSGSADAAAEDDSHKGNDWSNDDLNDNSDVGETTQGNLDEGGTIGQKADNKANTDKDASGKQGAQGGGHNYETPETAGNDWSNLADEALSDAESDNGLKDNNTALADAVSDESDDEERREGGVKKGERAWRPYDPASDEFITVQPSQAGKDHDRDQAERLYASVKDEASYLRSRLRAIVKALEMTNVIHGTRRGRRLSQRFLVDSRVSLMGKQAPKRAYRQVDSAIDTSLSAAIVLDQSGSMSGALKDVTRVLCAITEPLDGLGCPVQVSGFRDGYRWVDPGDDRGGNYHRYNGIVHDIFKRFDEPLRNVKWRFANTRATGGTPMADGVQFGLDSLSNRPEGHRILFVITDGQPNGGHMEIINRQCRLAKDAGVHVIGVGLGYGAEYVQNVFPDSVWTRNISDMPKALIAKLNDIIDIKAANRGKRIRSTG